MQKTYNFLHDINNKKNSLMEHNRRGFLKLSGSALIAISGLTSCKTPSLLSASPVQFRWEKCLDNPVLTHGLPGSWDENIRERMWVIYEDGKFHGWYGGWNGKYNKNAMNLVHLGYATSDDGMHWTKYGNNPVYKGRWIEDMSVVKFGDTYHMFAEDESNDRPVIHRLTSKDKIAWTEQGNVLEKMKGSDWEGSWVGTPLAWKESNGWYMLYEGGDPGDIGLAKSSDGINWKRVQQRSVLPQGIGWENEATAPDSILKKNGIYYLFYHATGKKWQSGMAVSKDLLHWTRYPGNPVFPDTSPVIVETPDRYFLYTTNDTDDPQGEIYAYVSLK